MRLVRHGPLWHIKLCSVRRICIPTFLARCPLGPPPVVAVLGRGVLPWLCPVMTVPMNGSSPRRVAPPALAFAFALACRPTVATHFAPSILFKLLTKFDKFRHHLREAIGLAPLPSASLSKIALVPTPVASFATKSFAPGTSSPVASFVAKTFAPGTFSARATFAREQKSFEGMLTVMEIPFV